MTPIQWIIVFGIGFVLLTGCETVRPKEGAEKPPPAASKDCRAQLKCPECPACPEIRACPTCKRPQHAMDPPFIQAIRNALTKVSGDPISATIDKKKQGAPYKITIVDAQHKRQDVYVDPETLQVLP